MAGGFEKSKQKQTFKKPVGRVIKGPSEILKERDERQPHPGRSTRTGRGGRGRGRGRGRGGMSGKGHSEGKSENNVSTAKANTTKQKAAQPESPPTTQEMKEWDDIKLLGEIIKRLKK